MKQLAQKRVFIEILSTFVIKIVLTDVHVPIIPIMTAKIVFLNQNVLVNIIKKCFPLDQEFKTTATNGNCFEILNVLPI